MSPRNADPLEAVIEVTNLHTCIGRQQIHRGLDLTVYRGELLGVIGSIGSGKTMLLRQMIGLSKPTAGEVRVLGQQVRAQQGDRARLLRRRWGVLFQQGALFSALNVFDNIAFPMRQSRNARERIEEAAIHELVASKLHMVGLAPEHAHKFPDQLSGGMRKRVALARALALEAEVLFLDEPTTGLDPTSAFALDQLLEDLHRELAFTGVMITHDLYSLSLLADRVAVLEHGRLLTSGTPDEVAQYEHPFVREFFQPRRGGERREPVRG